MSTQKVWLSTPFIKRKVSVFYLISVVILNFININDYGTRIFNPLIVTLLISDILNSRAKIITTEEKLEVISIFKKKWIDWQEVCEYNISPSIITLYSDRKSVEIDIKYLQEKEQFIELIKNKLTMELETEGLETECLSCGEMIIDDQDHCPKCNWSWEQ